MRAGRLAPVLAAWLSLSGPLLAQLPSPAMPGHPDWRHIGNSAIELSLASVASGAAERVWFSADGTRLFVRTAWGSVFETADFEKWRASSVVPPQPGQDAGAASMPDGARAIRADGSMPSRLYAFGVQVFRSDDGGRSWANLTAWHRESIIGGSVADLAISPRDSDEVVVANEFGVWRSLDGGASWTGLNEALPNLPARRLLALPQGSRGIQVEADRLGALEWAPGEKQAWRPVRDPQLAADIAARRAVSGALGVQVTALASGGGMAYAGSADGRLWVSYDRGRDWLPSPAVSGGAPVEGLYVDAGDPRVALAALGGSGAGPHVLRTVNGGLFWDDLTSDLPPVAAHGITADRAAGAVYVATDRGVYATRVDLVSAGPASQWTPLAGLPQTVARDVKLDPGANQLFLLLEGYGIYSAIAPHRTGRFSWANAADLSRRPAAPGSLLSILGGKVEAAQAGDLKFPVLASAEGESQIQVPFEAHGTSLSLSVSAGSRILQFGVPLREISPAIFVDRDGTPLLLDADTGVLLDGTNPARPNSRIQILTTGLGKVRPDWPAGMAGPGDNPPQVVIPIRAYLDRSPLEVTRAILAPGYVGLYLVEVQLPALVNAGPAELYLEAQDQQSNRVRVYLEP